MSPLIPLGILLVGAGLLAASAWPRFSYAAVIALTTEALALLALGGLFFALPASAALSNWQPATLFPVGLRLSVDMLVWLLAFGMGALSLATLLTGLARPGGPRLAARGAILLLTFAGLAALFADNVVTLVMAWAGLDLVYFATLVLLGRGPGVQAQAVLHLTFNSLGTLLALGAASLISRQSPDLSLRAAIVSPASALIMTLAAAFRLGLFPLHLSLPVETNVRPGLSVVMRLIPAVVALAIVARLAGFGFPESVRPWMTGLGVAAALVGAFQFWLTAEPLQGLTFVIIAESGLVLLTGLWGGAQAVTAVCLQTLALLLGGGLVFLANGWDERRPWLAAFPSVGAAVLLGAPLTTGFFGINHLLSVWLRAGHWALWLALAGVLAALILLAAGLLRAVSWPGEPVEGGRSGWLSYLIGLSALALLSMLVGGLAAPISQALGAPISQALGAPVSGPLGLAEPADWIGLLLVGLTAAGGGLLWRFEAVSRGQTAGLMTVLMAVVRLGWLYRLGWGVVRLVDWGTYNLAAVLEGEGALLWALVVVLAMALLFRG